MKYDFSKIEKKWQKKWEKEKTYHAKDGEGKKYYTLVEFPFLSGDGLHVGHIRSYTAMDIVARKRRMEGYNVLFPIGWDAFGLPTENYAIKTGIAPAIVTKKNADTFRRQLQSLGFSFDWDREVGTADPEYYKWTQWLFLQFFKAGLAYKAKVPINWCPKDKIGLANEEVKDGKCERCGTEVEQREKEQWMLKITAYADKLLEGLKHVDFLPEIKTQQTNWIGKSEGSVITFALSRINADQHPRGSAQIGNPRESASLEVFTTRPDTIFGATFIVKAGKKDRFTGEYVTNPATKEKIPVWEAEYVMSDVGTGVIMGVPAHDERDFEFAKKYKLPIKEVIEPLFVAKDEDQLRPGKPLVERDVAVCILKHWKEDKYLLLRWKTQPWKTFVVGGTDGEAIDVAAVREIKEETGYQNIRFVKKIGGRVHGQFFAPHKNENRFAHMQAVYCELIDDVQLPLADNEKNLHELIWLKKYDVEKFLNKDEMPLMWKRFLGDEVYTGKGILTQSGKFNGLDSEDAKKAITEFVGGKLTTHYKLRDWVFSRQRYWGEPIPLVFCEACKKRAAQTSADQNPSTPLRVNADQRGILRESASSQRESAVSGWIPVPETELPVELPNVKEFKPRDDGESPLASITKWVNVKCPQCGGKARRETDVMPNWAGSSWYFLRYTDPHNKKEFASRKKLEYWMPPALRSSKSEGGVDWYNGGMEHVTLHLLYSRFWNLFLHDQGLVPVAEPYKKRTAHGLILAKGGVKMSKSRGNVINPDTLVKEFGADALRLYEMFIGPFNQATAWDERGILGTSRFLEKVWNLVTKTTSLKTGVFKDVVLERLLNKTIKKVSEDIESMSFNTAVSALMIFMNEASTQEIISRSVWERFVKILSPFAPHIANELWENLGNKKSLDTEPWPTWDEALLTEGTVKIIVQVDGKFRDTMEVVRDQSEEEVKREVIARPAVKKWIEGKKIERVIFLKNRLINLCTEAKEN